MFDNLSCLIDAVSVLDSPPHVVRPAHPTFRQERLASVSSVTSLCSISGITALASSPPLHPQPRTKVPRKRISQGQTHTLQSLFDSGVHFPTRETRERLARQLSLTSRTIQVWFQNRRQAARNKARGVERPVPGQKMAIRWMKPVIFSSPPPSTYDVDHYNHLVWEPERGGSVAWKMAKSDSEIISASNVRPSEDFIPISA